MNPTLLSLLTGLISGAITAVVTYFATLSKARLDLSMEYDKELRANRLAAYRELWKLLKPLARYSPETPLTYQVIKETSESMRDWYFDLGGIFLSRESRAPYFALKHKMQEIIDNPELQKREDPLDAKWIKPLHDKGTILRETLSNDIGTRRQPFLQTTRAE
ncbi:MAG: hypothetical protein WAM82_23250 [Thermoanaerobaculia bacterium]